MNLRFKFLVLVWNTLDKTDRAMEIDALFTAGKDKNLKSSKALQETAAEVINVLIDYFEANRQMMKKTRKGPAMSEE